MKYMFLEEHIFFPCGPPVFSRALGCVARQGGRVYTTVQMRAPAGVRGACSGPSKSRILASDYGEAFDLLEPSRTMETLQ